MTDNNTYPILEGRKILVVDDEPDLREVLCERFEMEGSNVTVAENGRKALQLLDKDRFDVVISDIRMPGLNGLDLLKEIRTRDQAPAVILISGFSDVDTQQVLAQGAAALLVKPFNLEHLVHAISRALSDNRVKSEELKC